MNTSNAEAMEARILALTKEGRVHEAAMVCDQMNQEFPDYAHGWYTASKLALLVNEKEIALKAIEYALTLSPGKPEWVLVRIECLDKAGRRDMAVALAKQLSDHTFDRPYHAAHFGMLLSYFGLFEEARHQYQHACALKPDSYHHYYSLATVLRFLGDLDAADDALDRCLALNPSDAEAYLLRANLRTQTPAANNLPELKAAYARSAEQPQQRTRLCYALAKVLDDLEDYDQSFAYLAEASALRRQSLQYDPAEDLAKIRAIKDAYGADQFERETTGHINAEPIFVIGMPRTGNVLVERVLARHSVVNSAGQTMAMPLQVTAHCGLTDPTAPIDHAKIARQSLGIDYAALGEDYVAAARPTTDKSAHFVDCQPQNFLYAGFIRLSLPKARIVLLRRDPMDTCFAIFKSLFEGVYSYSYDLRELANYYVAYRELTDHWLRVIPDSIHVVNYEDLIADPVPVIEDLLEFCSLSFEEACVRFYDTSYEVTDAKTMQARRAFARASAGKWKRYEKHLQPVVEILDEAGLLSNQA